MGLMTGKQYIESLRKLKPVVYIEGERIDSGIVDHPMVRPSLNTIALMYDLACDPRYSEQLTLISPLIGEKISIFTNIPHSAEELEKKVKGMRLAVQKAAGTCIQRCATMDPCVPPYSVTYEMDQKLGTEYHKRYRKFVERVQKQDLYISAGVTDPKGDRTLRPHQQSDPDLYLRMVSKNSDGIVVRGAKFHQTGALGSHEKVVFPTRALTAEDKDYAIGFSVPMDAKGLVHVMGRAPMDQRSLDAGAIGKHINQYSSHTTMTFFDDVFIPWENVFMCGEWEYAARLIGRFGDTHRASYGGCKAGWADVLTGICANLAEIHGLGKDPIINDKLMEMSYLAEVMFSCGIACAHEGYSTPSGAYYPDSVLANTCKINISRSPFELNRLAEDIAGGITYTMPVEKDLMHPDLKGRFEKYMKEADGFSAEDRIRLVSLLSSMYFGVRGIGSSICDNGAAGSQQAARVHLKSSVDMEAKKKVAREAAGIPERPAKNKK